jgi:hypothetical protein
MSTSRAYVGILPGSGRVVFRESREPVADLHPEYTYAVGPFRTRAAADYFAQHNECRTVAAASGPEADALFNVAAGGKRGWTMTEWAAILASLDTCELTVADWLLTQ